MRQPPALRRPAFNSHLNLEALEDRLPPGQASHLATAAVGASRPVGPIAVDGRTLTTGWNTNDRDSITIGGFAGGFDSGAITGVNEAGPSANGNRSLKDPVQPGTERASPAEATTQSESASEVRKREALEGISILDPAANDMARRNDLTGVAAGAAGPEGAAWANGLAIAGNYGGTTATGTPALVTPSTGSAGGQALGGESGAPGSPAIGAIHPEAPAGTPVLSPAGPASRLSSVAYLPPAAEVLRVTVRNRNTDTMSGGWNPALRSIMVMDDGSRWFAAETGSDINTNRAMVYYRLGPAGWRGAGSVVLPVGIQQNMATVTNGRFIYSYGCTRSWVIETRFDTTRPRWNLATGNAIMTRGRVIHPGAAANYVGAAWHNNTRIVWWTSVGLHGTAGLWEYAYNTGSGWNRPVVSKLRGYNEVGYVRARFDDNSQIQLIGEAYRGAFPAGRRSLVAATLVLGNKCRWAPVLPRVARSPLDLWREAGGGATHYLYRMSPKLVGYSFGTDGAVQPTVFAAMTARFISDSDHLGLVLGYKRFVEVRLVSRADAGGRIDWAAVPPITIELPKALRSAGVSAIWTVDESRQPHTSNRLEFAICGGYPARDNLIYSVTVKGP